MDGTLVAHAVRLTRTAVGAGEDVPARADVVRRLDRPQEYVLVLLGPPGRPGWLAAVDPAADDVMTWAAVERAEPTVPPGEGELVWGPAAGSRSPLYPLRVSGDELVGLDGRPVRPRPGRG
ncbi:MAG: hypothetical protein BGO37_06095 [Cellulomonas sp. 73-92]|uniref:hypothetical protein n=1 Tax=Cellulomonas sp. 73-92 TaxID=1895740 RepID=UPI000927EF8A|nr:hypothetical protein [Cellulomonas sp. 73-92]OJV81508.1 MAG: hypothetical protein BGO37_06095 [Cellulomonas sp. 73-92]